MKNLWNYLGSDITPNIKLEIHRTEQKVLYSPQGSSSEMTIHFLSSGWAILNNNVVAKAIPEKGQFLARKEWQLSSFLKAARLYLTDKLKE